MAIINLVSEGIPLLHAASFLAGMLLCLGVALDAFQTIILPRRPSGRWRITRLFYVLTWVPWAAIGDRIENRKVREQWYSTFGPLSLLVLLALWAGLLITGFALLYFGLGSAFTDNQLTGSGLFSRFTTDLYVSGTTLFTLGLGDVTPHKRIDRLLVVLEGGTGLGFVALVIGYLPVIYQAFSRREVTVAMLDGRAGSPPTAAELLQRHGFEGGREELIALLREWEQWSAEILESHISYPILCYYRSQHDNQSWLSALVTVLDACALLITTVEGPTVRQAQLTFVMARHALIDLGHVFHVDDKAEAHAANVEGNRLSPELFNRLCDALGGIEIRLCGDPASIRSLSEIRSMYEPHAQALSAYLRMPLPLWIAPQRENDPFKRVGRLSVKQDSLLSIQHVSPNSSALDLHDGDHG